MTMRFSAHPGYRPTECRMCRQPLPQAATGRPRLTCSDRCRQRKRRCDYGGWVEPRRNQKEWRRAAREVKRMEKVAGSLDIPTPGFPYLTLARRVQIRLHRGESVPFCKVCKRPYINDTPRRTPTCQGRCEEVYREQQHALEEGLRKYAGKYDPRVEVRLRLGLPIKTCRQCGIPFPDYHPRRVYCSKRCNRNAWYARHPLRKCPECGEAFRGRRKTCSARCARKRHYHSALHCARCHHAIPPGREIPPNDATRIPQHQRGSRWDRMPVMFCSGRCRDALGWSPSRKVCEECREGYYPASKAAQRQQKYCSRRCGRRARYGR